MSYDTKVSAPERARLLAAALMAGTMLSSAQIFTSQASAQAPQSQARSINIPAGPLTPALNRLASQTGLQILFDATLAAGKRTNGVQGAQTPNAALAALLNGTGVSFRYTSTNTVTLTDPSAAGNSGAATVDGAVALDTIDVSGGGGASATDLPYQTPGASTHLSREQIDRVPPVTTGDLLRGTPGVMAATNRAGASRLDVNIRGLQGMNRVGITLDGAMQSFSTYRGYPGVDNRVYIDPDMIGGIDISKGPASGGQSVGTIGGVVAMRTLSADDILLPGRDFGVRLRGSIKSGTVDPEDGVPFDYLAYILGGFRWDHNQPRSGGSGLFDLNAGGGSVAVAGRIDNVEIVLAGSRRKSGNYFSGTKGRTSFTTDEGNTVSLSHIGKGEEVFNTSQEVTSSLAKIKLSNAEKALELGYNYYSTRYGENSLFGLTTTLGTIRPYYFQSDLFEKTVRTYTANFGWKPLDNDLVNMKARAWATDLDASDIYKSRIRMFGGELSNLSQWQSRFGEVKFDYGAVASFERSISDSDPGLGINGERTLFAMFANAAWKPTGWLMLQGGLKFDYYETRDATNSSASPTATFPDLSGTALSPRIVAQIEPWKGVQFYGKYEEGVRPPSLRENAYSASGLIPNPDLVPETARNFEVGFNVLKDRVFGERDALRLKAAYFENRYEDYISREQYRVPGTTTTAFRMTNIDRASFKGFELGGGYDARFLFAEGAINYYTDIQFCDRAAACSGEANEADYATNHIPPKFTASLTLGTRLFDEKLTLGGRVSYVGERALPLQQNPSYFSVTSEWAPYTLVDLFASYKFNENFRVDFSADNLFDRYYVDALNNLPQPAPGRVLSLTATATF